MAASILAIIASLVGVIIWWLRERPNRAREQLLAELRELEVALGQAIRTSDPVAIAAVRDRLRALAQRAGRRPL